MKIVAVICEYNPFHRGHEKQISAVRQRFSGEEVLLLSVMSGNYVQRGEPALLDKYARANAALLCGADLVVELPYPFSAAPADRFALAGVSVAMGMGADLLAFGSESITNEKDFLRWLSEVADFRDRATEIPEGHRYEDRSLSFARDAAARFEKETGLPYPALPNDRLAVEYLRAVRRLSTGKNPLSLLPLPREKDGYSAHGARELLLEGDLAAANALLPEKTHFLLENAAFARLTAGMPLLLARLRTAPREELSLLFDIPAEIAARLIEAAKAANDFSFDAFFEMLKNKNDSNARLRRSLLTALLRVTPEDLETLPTFALLLGAKEKGRAFLKRQHGKEARLPLFGSLSGAFSMAKGISISDTKFGCPMKKQAELQFRAELLYGFFSGKIRSDKEILSARPILL